MNRPRSRQAFALKRNVLAFLIATLIFFSLFLFFLSGKKQEIEENTSPFDPQQAFEIVPHVNQVASRNVNECDDQIETISWKPRIFRYKHFLTDEQCDYLLTKGKDKIVRSKVVGAGEEIVSDHRTSSGIFLDTDGDPEIIKIEKKISEWTSIPPIHYESFYLLRYQIGEQYKPHYDYFDKSASQHIGDAGQRTATVILCLNPALEGGTTSFPKVNITVGLEKGDALLFYDRLPNGQLDDLTLHAGDPVIRGEKWVITKWIRERPYDNNWYSREKARPVANPHAVNPFTGLPEFPNNV